MGGVNAAAGDLKRFEHDGFRLVIPQEGLALFDTALTADHPAVTAAPVDLAAVRAAGRVPPLLRGLVRIPGRRDARHHEPDDSLSRRLAELGDADRYRLVLTTVRAEVAAVLGHADPATIGVDRPFQDLGFDSLTAVDLRNRLAAATGIRLPATLVFDHPTPAALTESVLARVVSAGVVGAGAAETAPALAELDLLEAALARIGRDDDNRDPITVRLQTILSRWSESGSSTSSPDPASTLESASTAEIFDFIDNQLGRAAH